MDIPKLIDYGSYGYIYRPAIICECIDFDDSEDKKNYISKIIHKDDFFDTIHNENLLKKTKKDYFIFSKYFCNTKKISKCLDENAYNELNAKIKKKSKKINDFVNIIIPYGGINMHNLREMPNKKELTNINIKHLKFIDKNFNFLIVRMLKILNTLQTNNIIHGDLKLSNVLINLDDEITDDEIDDPNEYMKRIKLIDFDLVRKNDEHKKFKVMYYIYPPEANIFNFRHYDKNMIKEKFLSCLEEQLAYIKNDKKKWEKYFDYLIDIYHKKFNSDNYDENTFVCEYNKYIDLYAIGIILEALLQLSSTYCKNKIIINIIDRMTKFNPEKRITNDYLVRLIPHIANENWDIAGGILNEFESLI